MLRHIIIRPIFLVVLIVTCVLVYIRGISFGWVLLVVLGYVVATVYGAANIRSNYFLYSFSRAYKPTKRVALTFDDGPCNNTLHVLDLLKKHRAHATFFCIGRNIEPYAQILKRAHSEGHLIGNHSFMHSYHYDVLPTSKVVTDIKQCDALIEKAIGQRPVFFRPPYGVTNPNIAAALRVTGHTSVGWSLRTKDTVAKSAAELVTKVKERVRGGDILLFHDTKPITTEALAQLLPWLSERFELVRIDELMQEHN